MAKQTQDWVTINGRRTTKERGKKCVAVARMTQRIKAGQTSHKFDDEDVVENRPHHVETQAHEGKGWRQVERDGLQSVWRKGVRRLRPPAYVRVARHGACYCVACAVRARSTAAAAHVVRPGKIKTQAAARTVSDCRQLSVYQRDGLAAAAAAAAACSSLIFSSRQGTPPARPKRAAQRARACTGVLPADG